MGKTTGRGRFPSKIFVRGRFYKKGWRPLG